MMNEEIGYILEMLSFKTSIYRDKYKRNLSFNDDEYYANVLNEYIEDLQQRISKAIEWINKHIDTFEERNITIYDWNSLSNPKDLLEILGGKE